MALRAAAFDLDGVLADTFDFHIAGWKAVLREYHLPVPASFDDLRGAERNAALIALLREGGVEPTEVILSRASAIKLAVREERIGHLTPAAILPGITHLLDEANGRHVALVCISTNSATTPILERLGLRENFTRVIAGDDLRPAKNDSAVRLLTELRALGCTPGEGLYLDDSRRACTHAAAAGIPTVYVGSGALVQGSVRRPSLAGEQLLTLYERAAAALAR